MRHQQINFCQMSCMNHLSESFKKEKKSPSMSKICYVDHANTHLVSTYNKDVRLLFTLQIFTKKCLDCCFEILKDESIFKPFKNVLVLNRKPNK